MDQWVHLSESSFLAKKTSATEALNLGRSWGFPSMGVPPNRWLLSWKTRIEMDDDYGVFPIGKTSISNLRKNETLQGGTAEDQEAQRKMDSYSYASATSARLTWQLKDCDSRSSLCPSESVLEVSHGDVSNIPEIGILLLKWMIIPDGDEHGGKFSQGWWTKSQTVPDFDLKKRGLSRRGFWTCSYCMVSNYAIGMGLPWSNLSLIHNLVPLARIVPYGCIGVQAGTCLNDIVTWLASNT